MRDAVHRYAFTTPAFILLVCLMLGSDRESLDQGDAQQGSRTGAYQSLDFWTRSRSYPEADISIDGFFRGYEHARRAIREIAPALSPGNSWTFIGPTNFAGRTTCLAVNKFNPNTIYAGSASGGLWRTRTGGGDWTRVPTGFPVLGVSTIAIHPADTNTIYIGTGETYNYYASVGGQVIRTTRGSYGMGILKTTDDGATWTKTLDWSYNQQRGVQDVEFNPLNPSTVLAATSEGVFRTTDGGITWGQTLNVLMAVDILIHPVDTAKIIVTCGNFGTPGHGVYRSTDGGATFTQDVTLPSFSGMGKLDMWNANPDIVYASLADSTNGNGTLWQSTDFGATWNFVSADPVYGVQGWYSQFVAVHPTDNSIIVRGGQGLWKSIDGGGTSNQVGGGWADNHHFARHPTDANTVYLADDGGVWVSYDFGDNFSYIGDGLQTSQFYNGFSSSAQDSLLALGHVQDHFGWMYTGSLTWPQGGVDEVGWTGINQSNDMIMYAMTRNGGTMYKSTDRGLSYFQSNSGVSGGIRAWNAPFLISTSNPSVLYFGRSRIFRSTNSAASWAVTNGGLDLDGNPALSMAMSSTNPSVVYVGTAPQVVRSHVFRTTNNGTSWTDVTGILPDRYPMDIAVDPVSDDTVYLAYGGFGSSHLFKSTNAGSTWTDITGILPDVPATAIAIDPLNTNHVYAGTDVGVFISTDGGGTWSGFNDGLPEAVIAADLSISPSNRALRVATHSNGVHERPLMHVETGFVSQGVRYDEGWNMVSVPLDVPDDSTNAVFPGAVSSAFSYQGGNYTEENTLANRIGYWLKFLNPDSVVFTGLPGISDSVDVSAGWNLIGTVAESVSVSGIEENPPGIVQSDYFEFRPQGYSPITVLKPGKGYWVKASTTGRLILNGTLTSRRATTTGKER